MIPDSKHEFFPIRSRRTTPGSIGTFRQSIGLVSKSFNLDIFYNGRRARSRFHSKLSLLQHAVPIEYLLFDVSGSEPLSLPSIWDLLSPDPRNLLSD